MQQAADHHKRSEILSAKQQSPEHEVGFFLRNPSPMPDHGSRLTIHGSRISIPD
jgi:hypothetical protein